MSQVSGALSAQTVLIWSSASLAFLFRPRVLILDEPTAGLDPVSSELLKDKIHRTRDEGRLVLITSHTLSELEDIITEIVFTAVFVFIIASTSRKSMPKALTGVAVGLSLTLIHLITIPVDNTSVNPARSIATAVFQGSWALSQLWVFIVFPIVGGVIGAVIWRTLVPAEDDPAPVS